jgi:O-antigen/teichoic acid export membrane protein
VPNPAAELVEKAALNVADSVSVDVDARLHGAARPDEPILQSTVERRFRDANVVADLKNRALRGGMFTLGAQAAKIVLGLLSLAILSRLLDPADFGLVAMVGALVGFAELFKDLGLATATIQHPQITHAQLSTLFWLNVAVSVCAAVAVAAGAPAIAWFYQEPRLTPITYALACTFIVGGLTVQHQALLSRRLDFGWLAVVEVVSRATGITCAVIAANLGAGYWSLIVLTAATAVTNCVGVWLACAWWPGLPKRGTGVRSLLKFGGHVIGFNCVNYFTRNADNILIGWMWGAGPLGLYTRAYQLLLLPIQTINAPVARVAMASFSRTQHESSRLASDFLVLMSSLFAVTLPIVVASALFAGDIIHLVLGPRWSDSATIFRLLAVGAICGALVNPAGILLLASGQSKRYLKQGIVFSCCIVAAFAVGLPFGPKGVAVSYSVALAVGTIPILRYSTSQSAVKLNGLFKALLPALGAALAAALVATVVVTVGTKQLPALARLAINIAVFLGTYCAVLTVLQPVPLFGEIAKFILGRRSVSTVGGE